MTRLEQALKACGLALPELRYQRRIELESVMPANVDVSRITSKDTAWHELVDADVVEYITQIDAAIDACQDALAEVEDDKGDAA